MYLEYYKLNTKPFQTTTDPRFLWLGEHHKEALAVLRYGIMDNKGLLLLTGDVGIGKTTLINGLIEGLGDDVIVLSVPDPDLELIDLLKFIAKGFGIEKDITSKGDFLSYFNDFLKQTFQQNKKALLIIDESQKLRHNIIEEIRLLSNIEQSGTKLLNIFLIGQNEFNDTLREDRNRALRQRITVRYGIHPLSKSDTADYINHRLKIAGSQTPIFTKNAIREVRSFAEGLPRSINVICDRALLTGYVKGATKINAKIIKECATDLRIPQPVSPKRGHAVNIKLTGNSRVSGIVKNLIYLFITLIMVWFAISFFTGKQLDSLSFSLNLFNRTISVLTEDESEKSMDRSQVVFEQHTGVFHKIDQSIAAPKNDTDAPGKVKSRHSVKMGVD